MNESKDYLEMSFRSISCFSDDGVLDAKELKSIFAIAERDGIIDDNEIRVLKNIISKIKPSELTDDMKEQLSIISKKIA